MDSTGPLGGRFALEREVGRGGVGVVYRAYDLVTERPVALKVVAAEAGVAPDDEERLKREGELLRGLRHPGIVHVIASGFLDEQRLPFVAMEWLDGEDLSVRQRRQPLTIPQVAQLGLLVAQALEAAHQAGVVHRDIKPGNILLRQVPLPDAPPGPLGVDPVLVDFGVAMRMRVGKTNDIVGTPAYMAPEQARGSAVIDGRADLYSLGATLFELLAGRPPHVGANAIATLARLATTAPPSLRELNQHTPPLLDELVKQLLRTDPAERPCTAHAVEVQLREALEQCNDLSWAEPRSAPRLGSFATRLVTTLVALHFGSAASRDHAAAQVRARAAEAITLGEDALVMHLGAQVAVGNEAALALELGRLLARAGAHVGIASGRARLGLTHGTGSVQPVGEVVDRAVALARQAKAPGVLVDATTRELGRGRYEFVMQSGGSASVGAAIQKAYQDRVGGAPFLGRESEMAQVLSAYERCLLDSSPLLVSVTGPPGIGKSRLRREVLARVAARRDSPRIILQRNDAYSRAHALGAAADVVRTLLQLPQGATAEEAEAALFAYQHPESGREAVNAGHSLLAKLLVNEPVDRELDPRGSRDALWLAMTDLVLLHLGEGPILLVLEDLQWADPESIGWVDHLLGRASDLPLLVLACVRPFFWAEQKQRFSGRNHVRLDLRPLSHQAALGIASALLGEQSSPQVLDRIAEQAAGSPLFAEELARLTAAGRDPAHAPTIEAAIQVSLDALDEECRDAVGRLSVLGLTCWDTALAPLGVTHPNEVMRALTQAELLVKQTGSRFPETDEWGFQHALIRDVAYQSLGDEQRKELHARAAGWLASVGEDASVVAAHYDQGGQHETAAQYWERAAKRALTANALKDALAMAERALAFAPDKTTAHRRAMYLDEVWSRLDPRASDRETSIAALEDNVHDAASAIRARGARAHYDDARGTGENLDERLATVCEDAERLELFDEVARCAAILAVRCAFAGRFDAAEREAQRLLHLANAYYLKGAAVDAHQTLAVVRQTRGEVVQALESRRNAVRAARAAGLKEREAMLTTNLGFALTTIGARQEARTALEAGLALAEAIGSEGAARHARMNLLGWAAVFGDDKRLDSHLGDVRAEADAAASDAWTAPDRANLGTLFYRGAELLRAKQARSAQRAAALLRTASTGYRQLGHQDVLPAALALWAEAERQCGRAESALRLAQEAAQLLASGAPSLLNESVVYLALHDALHDQGDMAGAREAVARGVPVLMHRLKGLLGTPYARPFLTELTANAGLIRAAEQFGLVPDEAHALLAHHVV